MTEHLSSCFLYFYYLHWELNTATYHCLLRNESVKFNTSSSGCFTTLAKKVSHSLSKELMDLFQSYSEMKLEISQCLQEKFTTFESHCVDCIKRNLIVAIIDNRLCLLCCWLKTSLS